MAPHLDYEKPASVFCSCFGVDFPVRTTGSPNGLLTFDNIDVEYIPKVAENLPGCILVGLPETTHFVTPRRLS